MSARAPAQEVIPLLIGSIEPDPNQPRRDFGAEEEIPSAQAALEALASSVRDQGILQPILVRPIRRGRYMIIAGERRWRAAQMAGLSRVPAIVREDLAGMDLELAQLSENLQREGLSDLDVARSIQGMMERYPDLRKKDLARLLNRKPSYISRMMAMLDPRWSALTESKVITWASVLETFKTQSEEVQAEAIRQAQESGKPVTQHALSKIRQAQEAEARMVRQQASVAVPDKLFSQLEADLREAGEPSAPPPRQDGARIRDTGADFPPPRGAVPAGRGGLSLAEGLQRVTMGWDAFALLHETLGLRNKPLSVEARLSDEEIRAGLKAFGVPVPREEIDRVQALLNALRREMPPAPGKKRKRQA